MAEDLVVTIPARGQAAAQPQDTKVGRNNKRDANWYEQNCELLREKMKWHRARRELYFAESWTKLAEALSRVCSMLNYISIAASTLVASGAISLSAYGLVLLVLELFKEDLQHNDFIAQVAYYVRPGLFLCAVSFLLFHGGMSAYDQIIAYRRLSQEGGDER